ncbi:DUF1385 domain-containing protein [Microaceticoccus formicicus]|uniref:DUF1385 domain-containing protein n=1 Tax=Microaceticoccus formicicus TaxID=3118105 RepID=UPI003CCFFFCA|nr:DUF1385 domain-containing protein [Peptoniphilaceae bacterium AMB_02]
MTDNTIKRKTSIGGQALIEGIMMRGPILTSIAVRKPNGEIELKVDKTKSISLKIGKLPFIRGMVGLVDAMRIGTDALMYSASFYEEEEDESNEKKGDGLMERIFKDKTDRVMEVFALVLSVVVALVLFFFIPTTVTSLFKNYIKNSVALNLIEGLIRIAIFLTYISVVSLMEDMKRVFMYHGAEHKSIFCYEKGLDLTVENVRVQPRLHPRCGTSFLFSVMLISIVVLSFFGWPNPWVRMLTRLAALPLIVGISYEVNKVLGRSDNPIARALVYPGLFIQKIATVKEPTDDMIEVAITALKEVIPENPELDKW